MRTSGGSWHDHRRSREAARAQILERLGGLAQRVVRHGRAHGHARGQLYTKFDTIRQVNPPRLFTRAHFLSAARKLPAAEAAKFRHDLARVPDSFFTEMRLASRYGTYGTGGPGQRVPPRGIPELVVCEQLGSGLSCQNLNGDEHAPIGAGVYGAMSAPDWVPAPPQRPDYGLPPGIHFTRAEYQILIDLGGLATSTHSSGREKPVKQTRAPKS